MAPIYDGGVRLVLASRGMLASCNLIARPLNMLFVPLSELPQGSSDGGRDSLALKDEAASRGSHIVVHPFSPHDLLTSFRSCPL